MTIKPDLMLAVLAMDAYNRGFEAEMKNFENASIGEANYAEHRFDTATGFYAAVYNMSGQTVQER